MNKKKITLTAVFLIAFFIGFSAAKGIKYTLEHKSEDEPANNGTDKNASTSEDSLDITFNGNPDNANNNVGSASTESGSSDNGQKKEEAAVSVTITMPKLAANGTYSFSATVNKQASGTVVVYELKKGSKTIKTSNNGLFTGISPITSGEKYTLVIKEKSGKVIISKDIRGFDNNQKEETNTKKMSASEFQSLLCNDNDITLLNGSNPHVYKGIRYSVINSKRHINDVQDIRDNIKFGLWSSISVVSVSYDVHGKIISATISVTEQ